MHVVTAGPARCVLTGGGLHLQEMKSTCTGGEYHMMICGEDAVLPRARIETLLGAGLTTTKTVF
jgi:hypothetical protein